MFARPLLHSHAQPNLLEQPPSPERRWNCAIPAIQLHSTWQLTSLCKARGNARGCDPGICSICVFFMDSRSSLPDSEALIWTLIWLLSFAWSAAVLCVRTCLQLRCENSVLEPPLACGWVKNIFFSWEKVKSEAQKKIVCSVITIYSIYLQECGFPLWSLIHSLWMWQLSSSTTGLFTIAIEWLGWVREFHWMGISCMKVQWENCEGLYALRLPWLYGVRRNPGSRS